MKAHRYGREQRPMPMALSMRDLGAHLVSRPRAGGTTLTNRLRAACKMAGAVAALPVPREAKATLVMTKVIAAGIYGAPAAPASRQALQALRGRVARALDPGALKCVAKEAVFALGESSTPTLPPL